MQRQSQAPIYHLVHPISYVIIFVIEILPSFGRKLPSIVNVNLAVSILIPYTSLCCGLGENVLNTRTHGIC